MVKMNENIVGIDSAIFMHPTIGRLRTCNAFNDPLIDNKDSKSATAQMFWLKILLPRLKVKLLRKLKKRQSALAKLLTSTVLRNEPRVLGYKEKMASISKRLNGSLEKGLADVKRANRRA